MPWVDQYRYERNHEHLRKAAENQLLWVHRPLLVHERAPDLSKKCQCCDSRLARICEEREHLDVLINPRTGERVVRQQLEDEDARAEFDEIASRAKRLDMPRRVSAKQLEIMACKAKILAVFGGVRGGKSSFLADEETDATLEHGGSGAQIWWCAPTLEKTEIALRKLVLGEIVGKGKTKRHVDPILLPELVAHVPSSAKSDRKYVELVDGTRLHLKFLSKDGSNLKGDPPVFVGGDEFCAVKERENYRQLLDRLMEADGRLIIATTPVAGHWLKEEVYDAGVHVSEWTPDRKHAWAHLTAFDNPWVSEEAIRSTIASINDPQRVRREVYGEWVGDGPKLWRHFDEASQIVDCEGYRPEEWGLGLRNITRQVLKRFFRKPVDEFSGMDFDINPMSFTAHQIVCHKDLDAKDPGNWIFTQFDELIDKRAGTIHRFADALEDAGFGGWAIACDPSGAQTSAYRVSHGVDPSSTHATELEQRGFQCEPCHRSDRGRPKAPPVLDRCNVMHRLQYDRIPLPDGSFLPRHLIHKRCRSTIDSYRIQEADEHGMPIKEPGTESDRISGPTDAATYASWVPFADIYATSATWTR